MESDSARPDGARPGGDRRLELSVSVVIPTLDEAKLIGRLLEHLRSSFPGIELVVADGGSTDATVRRAEGLATVVHSQKGRGLQMNRGAASTSGDILWFLHADCRPTVRSVDLMRSALEDPAVVGGAFRWAIEGGGWLARLSTWAAHLKNRTRRNMFGDMGIFVRRRTFEELGGYREFPLFEDVDFSDRMKKCGRTVMLGENLPSSDRRYRKYGMLLTFVRNDMLKIAYSAGFSPYYIAGFY